ncbi:class I SAM-dependent methyltransferase [Thiocapsa bogorovii]|uniref:class I SAM-dependent methyltransferase n=1 Tax=Thiocapsa bogorovii TaxID=521689 RepID=UPI001E2D06E3|nr:class I SAM-dependent methyltransferase [Thiocapsa bogorovii]UHD16245.1 class I SAM-dependent methyltransferase [Thiocapsa bogorovii]
MGSGSSAKFACNAIGDYNLDTRIVSIDPFSRAEIERICDEVIRAPVEEVDLQLFGRPDTNDTLFIDSAHMILMNPDVTTIFLDVIPKLKSGVLVVIHDILLPYDYHSEWSDRGYSEQYFLASYILVEGGKFDIILPNYFISHDKDLKNILAPLWKKGRK